ncbi:uncharacterized protein N7483_000768 [Penicillium malachiteum]|uniref:uncharacterized protein n=1 Tax=Penicillium malachiteum TaxID=1324776 RepID=UPI00254904FE|nr:uncharacterized protein N7483_000768 [Penicillium malachiteum]KAJ5735643.1 hypothetical protein N7483_000768 [Penicillium malachiteum]
MHSAWGSSDHEYKGVDMLAILDCCFGAKADNSSLPRTTHILAASNTISVGRHTQQVSFTQRIHRAVCEMKAKGSFMTVPMIYEQILNLAVKDDPRPYLSIQTARSPIRFIFKPPREPTSPRDLTSPQEPTSPRGGSPSRILSRASPRTKKGILVKLTLHEAKDSYQAFAAAIKDLQPQMHAEVLDAFETDESFFCLLYMSWEAWCLWNVVCDLQEVGVTLEESLVHPVELMERSVEAPKLETSHLLGRKLRTNDVSRNSC